MIIAYNNFLIEDVVYNIPLKLLSPVALSVICHDIDSDWLCCHIFTGHVCFAGHALDRAFHFWFKICLICPTWFMSLRWSLR